MYGYKKHDWERMRPEKRAKIIETHKAYERQKSELSKMGYIIFKSVSAGANSSWSYAYYGNSVNVAWDSEGAVVDYLVSNVLNKQ